MSVFPVPGVESPRGKKRPAARNGLPQEQWSDPGGSSGIGEHVSTCYNTFENFLRWSLQKISGKISGYAPFQRSYFGSVKSGCRRSRCCGVWLRSGLGEVLSGFSRITRKPLNSRARDWYRFEGFVKTHTHICDTTLFALKNPALWFFGDYTRAERFKNDALESEVGARLG